jgi:hypothetical protein
MAIVIPSFTTVAATKTREDAFKISVMVQYLYERALTDGIPYRLVIDLDNDLPSAERVIEGHGCGEGLPLLKTATTRFKKLAQKAEEERQRKIAAGELEDTEAQTEDYTDFVLSMKQMALDDNTRIVKMATSSNPNMAEDGILSVYFYPHGYVEKAVIIIQSRESPDTQFSIVTDPLLGTARVVPGALEASEVLD